MSRRYVIDRENSKITVQAFASGLLSGQGHSPMFAASEFSGEIAVPGPDRGNATCFVVIKANSLRLIDKVSENDRREIEETMRNEILEVSRCPEVVFVGGSLPSQEHEDGSGVELAGELTLHGRVLTHLLSAEVRMDSIELRARGESKLKQSAYGIKPFSAAGGMLKVKDEVKISFDLIAKAVSPPS